ncbi:hypothetical protein [Janthinobacterium sp. JC611]|uniref:hypothetical protein n=1 Tax=Janthinobacterium sp. JC611 TaxID=2816201 RepID=UPI001BFE95C2|nr:hypothetical protein [Janthinobacterium sp. JC611]
MRHTFFLVAILASGAAHADWVPVLRGNNNVVTVSYNGGSASYQESAANYDGRLSPFIGEMRSIRTGLENKLNSVVGATVAEKGITFRGGSLSGNLHANIQPAAPNTLLMSIDGISYEARSTYSGKRWGILTFDCTNTFSAKNISLTGQYGANDGVLLPSVGLNSNVNSSTDCDSNLGWILPIVGDLLVNKVTGILDSRLEDGVRSAMNEVKDKLLYMPDPAWGIGMLRLVPNTMQITAPDGRTFNIGQIVANNLPYLLGNSQIDLQFGLGMNPKTVPGTSAPQITKFDENVVTLSVTSPSISFSVRLSQQAYVDWKWKCPVNSPPGGCREP